MPDPGKLRRLFDLRSRVGGACRLIFVLVAGSLHAQLEISDSVQTHVTLTDTTVILTGKSELHVTGSDDPTSPISGSTIHLNSHDSWFWLDNIRPAAAAGYLGQIRVNGAVASHGGNVRIVQYGMGTVITPFSNAEQPLETFTDPGFQGQSKLHNLYTYYNTTASLGAMHRNLSSFKLKRGFMATFATEPNGRGTSKVYVAQDHDLNIANLPAELDNEVEFVRVFPWRWVSKKGSCDVSPDVLNAAWHYNWNNNRDSTLNWEYVPIKQQPHWPGNPVDKRSVTHWLGFNEPNNPVEDAYQNLSNGSVDAAIAWWPNMLSTGHRIGSPAVTDGGKAWLYEFMDKAIAANLRVDYIAIHNYQCGRTAASLKSWLEDVWNRYQRPIWLTEFNNGANWTGCADPTTEQNAEVIGSFINMMDDTPWIERYAVYGNVEWQRNMTWDARYDGGNGLTPAGVVYRDQQSPIGYQQEALPRAVEREVMHLPMDGDTRDASGHDNRGITHGSPVYVDGQRGQALDLDGASRHVRLPAGLVNTTDLTLAAWVNWDGGGAWQRVFDFGNGGHQQYLFLTPAAGDSGNVRFAIKDGGAEQQINHNAPLPPNTWTHVAVTISGNTGRLFINGSPVATNLSMTIDPADLGATVNYLGDSQFTADPLFDGQLDEVVVTDSALTTAQIAALMTNDPPEFASDPIDGGSATPGIAYSGSLAPSAIDPGDTLTFSKLAGPDWLVVAPDGTLGGIPTAGDNGTQLFTVAVTDFAGATAQAGLTIELPSVTGTAVPDAMDGIQNLAFSTSSANNTSVQNVTSEYLAGDNANALGQTFTTGPNPDGYSLRAISVRQVSWGPTFWDYTGGSVTLKVFTMGNDNGNGVWNTAEIARQTIGVGEEPDGIGYSTGTPGANARWLTVNLDSPVTLDPDTLYGFMLLASGTGGNDEFFIELDGTATNSYPGGFALTTVEFDGSPVWDGNNGRPGDRAFVAAMTALGEPDDDYQAWIDGYDLGVLTGFADDADGDGVPNGVENFLGTNPGASSRGLTPVARTASTFTFQHPQNPAPASDIEASYRWSMDLLTWHADGATIEGTTVEFSASPDTPTAGTTTVTATITGPVPEGLLTQLEVLQSTP